MASAISNPAVPQTAVIDTPMTTGGASAGGYLVQQKDRKTPETEAQFGEVLKQIQAKYGAKAEKPREIKKTLGKDDFLKIMITQMKNQDPTKPFNADQMAAQMAQYASVEQLQNVNQNLTKMTSDHQTGDRMAMTALIGKTVTVDRERFPHTENQPESIAFALTKAASEVKIAIQNEAGETVLEKDMGPQKAGEQSFSWDGNKSNTLPAKGGTYTFKIVAKDEQGRPLPTNPKTQGRIIGVSFEGAEPVFLVGDAHSQTKITMKNIVRIDDTAAMAPGPNPYGAPNPAGAQQAQQQGQAPAEAPQGGKFFTFQKGVGSQNLDPADVNPEVQQALAQFQSQQAEHQAEQQSQQMAASAAREKTIASAPANGSEKGFPNGLTSN